jgi:DNA mismatch repair ATPase MutS
MALEVHDAVHPLLENGVGNSADFQHGVLITGSNASGKSTFIKTLAVNAILAQSINTCSAASFTLPRARVMSSMALRDNLAGGESYFVVEVKSFRRILQAVKASPCLCFVDEILRGTNTVERIAASAAVLRSLQQGNSLCVAATHDIELAAILSGLYDNYHFQEELKDRSIHFDYKLRPGPSHTRNALLLLHAFDFPDHVVREAMEMVASFEREHRWPAADVLEGGGSPAPAHVG